MIKVYSNCKSGKLTHNGRHVADLTFESGKAVANIPLANGMNNLLVVTDSGCADVVNIDYRAQNPVLKDGFQELNVLLGSNRNFTEFDQRVCWVAEKEYTAGSWGYVGGYAFRPKSGKTTLPAAEMNILDSDNDPMYQTQRRAIEAFKADVPDGRYAVYMHWAELIKSKEEALAYNLGRNSQYDDMASRSFGVAVNGDTIFKKLNVFEEVGGARPFVVKVDIVVENGDGINISLNPVEGETMLTAVRIVKMN